MSAGWGTIRPRQRSAWRMATIVGPPQAVDGDAGWRDARLALQLDDDSAAWMRLGELARPMSQLASAIAATMADDEWGGHQIEAALTLQNSGIPIAVLPATSGEVRRPSSLFATWDAADGRVAVAPNHTASWLQHHAGKHLVSANAKDFGAALRASGLHLDASTVVGMIRGWSGDIREPSAWPLLEVYSLLLAVAFATPGPTQAYVRWLQTSHDGLADELALLGAEQASRNAPGVDAIVCATVPRLRAIAKGGPHGLMGWATLHPASVDDTRARVDRLRRYRALYVQAVE